jgi:hypothetical protein
MLSISYVTTGILQTDNNAAASWEFWLTLLIAVAAILSAFFGALQAHAARKAALAIADQFQLASRPFLYVEKVETEALPTSLGGKAYVKNSGVTPAILRSAVVTHGESRLNSSNGLLIYPGQDYAVTWSVSEGLERIRTGYEPHRVNLVVDYGEEVSPTSRQFGATIEYDSTSSVYRLIHCEEVREE